MPGKTPTDSFANQAVLTLTESAANTLTFKKLETGVSLFDKVAWIIHRIEYFFYTAAANFNHDTDNLKLGLCTSNTITSLSLTDANILDLLEVARIDYGAAASGMLVMRPHFKDFTNLPGGGLIVPPSPLYGACQGSGLVSATTSYLKFYYTVKELATEEYWELVEARRIIAS